MAGDLIRQQMETGRDRIIEAQGSRLHLRLTQEDTDGAYALIEYDAAPHFPGPPTHLHRSTEEFLFMLDGALHLELSNEQMVLEPGNGAFIPRQTAHTFANPRDEPARFLVLLSPGGFEGYIAEVASLAAAGQWPPAPDVLTRMAARYDIVLSE